MAESSGESSLAGTKRKRSAAASSSLVDVQTVDTNTGPFAELFPLAHDDKKSDVDALFTDPITLSCLFGPDLTEPSIPLTQPRAATLPPVGGITSGVGESGGSEKKMHVCPVPSCNKEFRDRSGLRKHKKAKHSFNCPHDTCGKVFPMLEALLAHMHEHAAQ